MRHASYDDGTARAGLEFVDVGALERALLLRLLRDMNTSAAQSAGTSRPPVRGGPAPGAPYIAAP